jgi:hypothetical protein
MKNLKAASLAMVAMALMLLTSCGRDSSPEGRMTMKIESLQKEMIDSLQQQNKAILDSLAALRKDVQALQQAKKQ